MDNSTSPPELHSCIWSIPGQSIFTAWFTVYLLFLPVFLFVLYIAFNKWKKPQSSASGGLSHSDVFTLHMVAMEMASISGSCVVCYGYFGVSDDVAAVGEDIFAATATGQMLFHSLTCVERYLAVVRPVTYLRLRREGGVTVRNIGIAFVWVFSAVSTLLFRLVGDNIFYASWGILLSTVPLPLVLYCGVHVLRVLVRPKPGDKGGLRKQISQSKRTTIYTMAAILGVLVLRLTADVACYSTFYLSPLKVDRCVFMMSSFWPTLPSSLVLPLLFLQRAGKLTVCKWSWLLTECVFKDNS